MLLFLIQWWRNQRTQRKPPILLRQNLLTNCLSKNYFHYIFQRRGIQKIEDAKRKTEAEKEQTMHLKI
jgi:hypothetical protein